MTLKSAQLSPRAAIGLAQRAFGTPYREPGHNWWTFDVTPGLEGCRLAASVDRGDIARCRKREVIIYTLVLLGWSWPRARLCMEVLNGHIPQPLGSIVARCREWGISNGINERLDDDVA